MRAPSPREGDIVVEPDVYSVLPDGTRLCADIYRPSAPGRYPALLLRIPYNKSAAQAYAYAHPIWYARYGYVVVVQDSRGRWKSDGEFYPLRDEGADGLHAVQWVADLPHCDGQVGLYGYSYVGMSQLLTAAHRPSGLRAIAPAFTGSDHYDGWAYNGGTFALGLNAWWTLLLAQDTARRRNDPDLERRLNQAARGVTSLYWTLPLRDHFGPELRDVAPYYFDWLAHLHRDDYWKAISPQERYAEIDTPALHIGGWYDSFVEGTLRNYAGLRFLAPSERARRGQRLIIGPWHHNPWSPLVGQLDMGPAAANTLDEYQVRWFDYWLKGIDDGIGDAVPVQIFVMGEQVWRSETEWPPARVEYVDYYLHSGGRANSINGDGTLSPDSPSNELPDVFICDPRDPVPTIGGRGCCVPEFSMMGPTDQRPVQARNDVLVYTTLPLERELEVTGMVTAVLWAASSAADTDFAVKLIDVHPDGRSINLCDGIVRARCRESLERPSVIVPNEVYRYTISVGSTSNLFRRGHRVRVLVASSNFPASDRNPNTGLLPAEATQESFVVATQTVFHDSARSSHIHLPIVPR